LARLLVVKLPRPASRPAASRFAQSGLAPSKDGLEWRLLCEDALGAAQMVSPEADAEGGEVAVRRPGLDDLVAHLSDALS
jgi:ABC-2 type transport system ATP-binding protein